MAKSQTIIQLTIITALFLGQISATKRRQTTNTSNSAQPAGITGEQVACTNVQAVGDLIFKNSQKLNMALPKYYKVKECSQAVKVGQFANYIVTFDYRDVECTIKMKSKPVAMDKREPTTASLQEFADDVSECLKKVAEVRVNKWVVKTEENIVPELNNLEDKTKEQVEQKLMAGLTGEATVCSDADKVAALFLKVSRKLQNGLREDYEVVDCQQQFKLGSYSKYLLSLKYGDETCELFMESLPTNFDKRAPTKATQDNFKEQLANCNAKTAKKVEEIMADINQKMKEEIVEIITQVPEKKEIEHEHIDYVEVVAEEINNRLAKKNLPGFTGELTDCVNSESVSELFQKNAKKLNVPLAEGYTIVECKQAIKLNQYYNYAMLVDYNGQQCELYLETTQLQFNKRAPTKATKQQFIDLVSQCNELVNVSEDDSSIDNSAILDMVEFMTKEVEMALALENLYNQMNQEDVEEEITISKLFEDEEDNQYNVDLAQLIYNMYNNLEDREDSFESSDFNSSLSSSNYSESSFGSSMEESFGNRGDEMMYNGPLLGLVGHAKESDWEVAADAFAKLVVADMLQGKVVYKQNVLKSQTQVFSGVMTAGVYSFDGVVCELKVFAPASGDKKLKIYHDSVTMSGEKSHFAKTLNFSPYSHPNCVDVFGTEQSGFLLSQASK